MNIKGFHKQSYLGSHLKVMIILHQKLVTTTKHRHFIVHPFEYGRLHYSCQLCHIGYRKNIQVFGTNHHIYRHVFTKTFVHTFELRTAKTYQLVFDHGTVQYITLTDKIGNKRIDRLIVYIDRRTYLLNPSLAHHHNGITQRQSLFLIVSHIYKCNAQTLVHLFQLHLHIFTHFEIERSQRFVEQQNFRLIDNGTGNGYPLLLSAGERIDITVFIIRHAYHLQGSLHFLFNDRLRCLFQLQTESDIIIHIQMRKKSVFLKNRVHRTLMGRCLCYFLSRYSDFTFRSRLKAGNKA